MKERGIIFNTEDVRSILAGRKTVTRRPVKKVPIDDYDKNDKSYGPFTSDKYGDYHKTSEFCPFGQIGDRMWVRESFRIYNTADYIIYRADIIKNQDSYKWKSPAIMPRSAARIWLEITDIRVERLGDITEEDEEKEGINYLMEDEDSSSGRAFNHAEHYSIAGIPMRYSPEKYGMIGYFEERKIFWDESPWVWVIEFKVIKK